MANHAKMTKEQKTEALNMIRQGMSQNSIADFYGVSRQYVWKIRREAGFAYCKPKLTFDESMQHQKIGALTQKAIYYGVLIPEPCEICGAFGKNDKGKRKVHAHHDDYNKPLNVRWLCEEHHREWHRHNIPVKCRT